MMVAGHTGLLDAVHCIRYVSGFYMPMFFFVSGYFLDTNKYDTMEFLKRKCKTLLIPYIFWAAFHLLLLFCKCICKFIMHYPLECTIPEMLIGVVWNNNDILPIAGALWFLTCLFLVEMIGFCVVKYTKGIATVMLITVITGVGLYGHIFLPWSGDSALVAVCFYFAGYYFKEYLPEWWDRVKNAGLTFQILLVVCMNLLYIFLICLNGKSNIRICEYGKYPILYILHAILGIGIWWLISYLLDSIRKKYMVAGYLVEKLRYIGENSMLFA